MTEYNFYLKFVFFLFQQQSDFLQKYTATTPLDVIKLNYDLGLYGHNKS